jgi:hypothetical protein
MRWTYAELQATPHYVVAELIAVLKEEQSPKPE